MQLAMFGFLLATSALVAGAEVANPLGKVLELMDEFSAKLAKEGEEADGAYRKYVDWCDDSASEKRFEIKTATSKKEKLESKIDKLSSDISASSMKIDELVKQIASETKDLEDATVIREKEASEFAANEAELEDTVDTLSRAISIITKEMKKNPAAFTQTDTSHFQALMKSLSVVVDAAAFSSAGKQKLLALVQSSQGAETEEDLAGAPAAAVYESHSGDLVEVLEDLKEKSEDSLSALRKAETNAKQNYEMLKQSLMDATGNANKDLEDEKAAKSAAGEKKAQSEKDLATTVKGLEDAQERLEEIKSTCMKIAADHEESVTARNDEMGVIAKAKKILMDTSSGAVDQSYSLFQVSEKARFGSRLQTRADLKRIEVVSVLRNLANKFHSAALAQLASRISAAVRLGAAAGEDPFVKIKGMISDLIAKLEAEAEAAADEKAYCDDQMAKTEEKKGELEEDLDKLKAKIDEAAASSAGLKNDVKELQGELAALAKLQAEMDAIRKEQHDAYTKAKSELTLGLEGVRKALSVLREYYGSSAAASLLQNDEGLADFMKQPSPPVMHSKGSGSGGGIIGILEVCESDFSKNLAVEEEEEADEQSEYDRLTQDNAKTKTLKEQDVLYKVKEFKTLDKSVADMTGDKDTMSTELKAVLEYYAKVKDRCVAKPETYEERKARREAEINGLKEALQILEQETAFVELRTKRATRGHLLGVAN